MIDNLRGLAGAFTHARSFRPTEEVTALAMRLTLADNAAPSAFLGLSAQYHDAVQAARNHLRDHKREIMLAAYGTPPA